MPVQFDLPPLLLLGPLLAAVVVYLVLRWVIWAPRTGTSPASVSEHALWVGVIGWLASSLQGAMNLGIIPANPSAGAALTTAGTDPPGTGVAGPGLPDGACPGPDQLPGPAADAAAGRPVRPAHPRLPAPQAGLDHGRHLRHRRRGHRPDRHPARDSRPWPPPTVSDGQYTYYNGGGDGRIPGPEVAGWLGGALLVLAGGTWLVLWLIARRRQLESLDAADNAVLRTIAMNRLLRTVSTVAAGLAVIAGNFAARPDPAQGMTSWTNPAGLACTVVLLVMWWWRPPRLAAAGLGVRNRPEARDRRRPAAPGGQAGLLPRGAAGAGGRCAAGGRSLPRPRPSLRPPATVLPASWR